MGYTETKGKIDEIKRKIEQAGELSIDKKNQINYRFRLDWNYYSNSMEGNTLTSAETRSLMIGNVNIDQKSVKDVMEMLGHNGVITEILKIGKGELRLSENRIKTIHAAIMYEESEDKKKEIGNWKSKQNMIYNHKGEKFDFVPPDETASQIHELLNRTNADIDAVFKKKKNAAHPLDIAFNFHLDYLTIHPFYDGNGRTARILSNLILISLGYTPFWITETERQVYYNYISDIQGYGGEKEPLFQYLANLVFRSEKIVMDVIENRDISMPDDVDKEVGIFKKTLGKEVDLRPKTLMLLVELYQHSLKTLFDLLGMKLLQFDEMFVEKRISVGVTSQNSQHYNFQTIDGIFEALESQEKLTSIDINDLEIHSLHDISQIVFRATFLDFKHDQDNTFWAKSELYVFFEKYTYIINDRNTFSDTDFLIKKMYSDPLTETEINTILKKCIGELLNSIKSQKKSKP